MASQNNLPSCLFFGSCLISVPDPLADCSQNSFSSAYLWVNHNLKRISKGVMSLFERRVIHVCGLRVNCCVRHSGDGTIMTRSRSEETSLMSGFVAEFNYDSMCSRLLLLIYGNCTWRWLSAMSKRSSRHAEIETDEVLRMFSNCCGMMSCSIACIIQSEVSLVIALISV